MFSEEIFLNTTLETLHYDETVRCSGHKIKKIQVSKFGSGGFNKLDSFVVSASTADSFRWRLEGLRHMLYNWFSGGSTS